MIINVNPATIRGGQKIVTKTRRDPITDELIVVSERVVKRVSQCGKLECIHLDHECYDTRFSTVMVKQ